MCVIKIQKMVSSLQSTLQKLQQIINRQNVYYNSQIVKDLNEDELEQYLRMRNACVQYIKGWHVFFDTGPDAVAAAIGILDVFLWKVKVTEKHMTIVSAACFLLACKIKVEDELCPLPSQLASFPLHSWSANDLCRMELHILKKLEWSLSFVTYLDYLPLLTQLSGVNDEFLCHDSCIALAERCLLAQSTVLLKPSVLAFSLLQHASDNLLGSVNDCVKHELNDLFVKYGEMCEGKKLLSDLSSPVPALFNQPAVPRKSVSFPMKVFDRPSEIGSTCLPTICEE